MVTQTNEQALEACIEKALTGTCREQLKLEGLGVADVIDQYRSGHLYWLLPLGSDQPKPLIFNRKTLESTPV